MKIPPPYKIQSFNSQGDSVTSPALHFSTQQNFISMSCPLFRFFFISLSEPQVNALRCSGGVGNLTLLDSKKFQPSKTPEAGLPLNSELKWKVGEAEFESLMRMLDNLVSDP